VNTSDLLDAIVRRSRGQTTGRDLPGSRAAILRAYFTGVPEEDLRHRDLKVLAAAALTHVASARSRRRGVAIVRAFNPAVARDGWHSDASIVQLVNDDMPFLVDSVTMTLNRLGHRVQLLIHPILGVKRSASGQLRELAPLSGDGEHSPESFIHIEISKVTDAELLKRLQTALEDALGDVRAAVDDWPAMLTELRNANTALRQTAPTRSDLLNESCDFLDWLADDHFTLLGYREYELSRDKTVDRLRAVAGTGLGISRDDPSVTPPMITLNPQARKVAKTKTPLVITKADSNSTIHRSGHLDQIGVKVFDADGKPRAVKRFVGLFTSAAYTERPGDVPLVRLKIDRVLAKSGLDLTSHSGKALQHILNTFPRDDLFQGSTSDLAKMSAGILNLQERHQVKLFCRRDAFNRFYSCFVYLPRDQYNPRTQQRIEALLLRAFKGTSIETKLTMSESALARLEATVRIPPDVKSAPNIAVLEEQLAAVAQTWRDRLRAALLEQFGANAGLSLFHRFAEHFPAGYREEVDPAKASDEIQKIAAVIDGTSDLEMSLDRMAQGATHRLHFTTFRLEEPIQLYTALPILEHMGMKVLSERLYRFSTGTTVLWIQKFELEPAADTSLDPDDIEPRFLECFRRVLTGEAESDQFNSFVAGAGLDWREAALLRAYCKYLLQTVLTFSQTYMQEVLGRHTSLTHSLIEYFHALFDPDNDSKRRRTLATRSKRSITNQLERVTTLDEDRILRAFLSVIEATLRTNFYRPGINDGQPYISFKLDSAKIVELPEPRPKYEIFVYSPRFEGVHLRCGTIARGGLRWSDRREDFRTEVLGLMKAQQVKNTVIVPSGAKGGFVCKQLPDGDPETVRSEVVACYQNFIRGLLAITDNIVDERVVTPERVICRDGDDPYLVVAADKGTATFSDFANEIAADYGFWLGDAFASGGSAGFDHKKMGITARGTWECVKRHFRELGVDTQKHPVTVAGIGDMGGDVFGNGMLMSPHIRLVAAFNHRHIFIDPDPDTRASFSERKRLFQRSRSGWDEYNAAKLSEGGGVHSRDSKIVELHPAAQRVLGLDRTSVTPPELVRSILRMEVDLLWNGGIGTYIKSSDESHGDVGDPANDIVRVNGDQLRCRVIGEGGNLGLTQLGRIEFALLGGRVNTDFIDNSGGVDTSDREVNIKILLDSTIANKKLPSSKRNDLLAEMTDEIAELVLVNNYGQSQALSMMSTTKNERLGENVYLIRALEARGLLDRDLEDLPAEADINERRKSGDGLTRPELAVIMSYAKIDLFNSLMETDTPEDPYLSAEIEAYFPARLQRRFAAAIASHRLRREIIATRIASSMINRMGASFAIRAEEDTGSTIAQVARAYAIAREIFDVRDLWREIEACDNQVPAELQYDLLFQISRRLRHAVYWLLKRRPQELSIEQTLARFSPGVGQVRQSLARLEGADGNRRKDVGQLKGLGIPVGLAERLAALAVATQTLDIIEIADDCKVAIGDVAPLYFELGRGLRLDWIRAKIEKLHVEGRWPATARATLRENLAQQQNALIRSILAQRGRRTPRDALTEWLVESKDEIARARQNLKDMDASGVIDFATLSVAIREIERLTS
jgi:glutamate dehydrogenase